MSAIQEGNNDMIVRLYVEGEGINDSCIIKGLHNAILYGDSILKKVIEAKSYIITEMDFDKAYVLMPVKDIIVKSKEDL